MFTTTNGVKELLHFLMAKSNDVENWLRIKSDPAISHAGSREKHAFFGRGIQYSMQNQRMAYERNNEQDLDEK